MKRDLYTDQMHLKRLLAGQATAAFTPLTPDARKLIDPNGVPGMGAMKEDPNTGYVQCPVRGCGEWVKFPGRHASTVHRNIGGARAIRAALGIPQSTPLMSARVRREYAAKVQPRSADELKVARSRMRTGREAPASFKPLSMQARNYADTCPAQLKVKISALARKLGRRPTADDVEKHWGREVSVAIRKVFGSWGYADEVTKLLGATERDSGNARRHLVWLMREIHRRTGDFPAADEVKDSLHISYETVLRVLRVDNWGAAMRSVVEETRLSSERYGRPSARVGDRDFRLSESALMSFQEAAR